MWHGHPELPVSTAASKWSVSKTVGIVLLPRVLIRRRLEQELAEVGTVMSDLRTKLYARLGDSINLDVPRNAAASKA